MNTDNQLKDITQGEWKIRKTVNSHYGYDFDIVSSEGWHIANINPFSPEYVNSEANAKAIANLPNILKENEELKDRLIISEQDNQNLCDVVNQLKEANRELLKALNCIDQILKI